MIQRGLLGLNSPSQEKKRTHRWPHIRLATTWLQINRSTLRRKQDMIKLSPEGMAHMRREALETEGQYTPSNAIVDDDAKQHRKQVLPRILALLCHLTFEFACLAFLGLFTKSAFELFSTFTPNIKRHCAYTNKVHISLYEPSTLIQTCNTFMVPPIIFHARRSSAGNPAVNVMSNHHKWLHSHCVGKGCKANTLKRAAMRML